jgi:neutral trehalase
MQASQRTINEQLNNSAPVNEHFSLQTTTLQMCLEIRMSGEVFKRRRKEETKHIENTQKLVTEEIEVLKPVLYWVARNCTKWTRMLRRVTLSLHEGFCRLNHHDFFNQLVAC